MPARWHQADWPVQSGQAAPFDLDNFYTMINQLDRNTYDYSIDILGFPGIKRSSRPERAILIGTAREDAAQGLMGVIMDNVRRQAGAPVLDLVNRVRSFLVMGANNLHLAVGNAIKDDERVCRALGICRKLVATFSHSWKKKQEMTKAQQQMALPQLSLVTDWGSVQKIASRVLEQEKLICKVLSEEDRKTSHLIPTWQDIDVLESIEAALGPLANVTDMLSAENFVMSAILPVLHILRCDVLMEAENDTQLTKDIQPPMLVSC